MIHADIPIGCQTRNQHHFLPTNGKLLRIICTELICTISPIGGNVTRSSRDYGTQLGAPANRETFSNPSFNSPLEISKAFSVTPRQRIIFFAVEFCACRRFLLPIRALTCFALQKHYGRISSLPTRMPHSLSWANGKWNRLWEDHVDSP